MKQLPDKPSELLKLALTNMEAVERTPGYKIDMSEWHNTIGKTCRVCLAGAVMARSLGAPKGHSLMPSSLSIEYTDIDKLRAIDCFRGGHIFNGLQALDKHVPAAIPTDYSTDPLLYSDNPTEWLHHMCTIIGILEAEGL